MASKEHTNPRGLTQFITDIRNSQSKEAEQKRVDKEMAKIRAKFSGAKKIDSYDKKKYTWKLLYMYTLGYELEFGHMEAVNLISSPRISEKQVGYLAVTLLLKESDEFLRLITNSIRNDLHHANETIQALALTAVGNVGGKEFAEALGPDVQKLLVSSSSKHTVKKKAALCLLRLFRRNPEIISADTWAERLINLLEEKNFGVLTSVLSLLLGVVAHDPSGYEESVPKVTKILSRIVLNKEFNNDYLYYGIPSPWLQVKLLRLLQYFPPPPNSALTQRMSDCLQRVISSTEVTKNVNKNNASHAVLFESINLVIHMDCDQDLMGRCVSLLGRFISIREPNIRYLGLEHMARLATYPDTITHIKKHQSIIIYSLKDADISIRRRAMDLLYAMCDRTNCKEIVDELLKYLTQVDYSIREELVLKIAILAERFATDLRWYIDVILQLMHHAGDFVSDEVTYRVVQIVTNHEDLQFYAAQKVLGTLETRNPHENAVKLATYILGEFGHLVADCRNSSPARQLDLLQARFKTVGPATQAIIMTSYMKFLNAYPELKPSLVPIFADYMNHINVEIQQRACEYTALSLLPNSELVEKVLDVMPRYPERDTNFLIKRLYERKGSTDRPAWTGPINNTAAGDSEASKGGIAKIEVDLSQGPSPTSGGGRARDGSVTTPGGVEGNLLGEIDTPKEEHAPVATASPADDLASLIGPSTVVQVTQPPMGVVAVEQQQHPIAAAYQQPPPAMEQPAPVAYQQPVPAPVIAQQQPVQMAVVPDHPPASALIDTTPAPSAPQAGGLLDLAPAAAFPVAAAPVAVVPIAAAAVPAAAAPVVAAPAPAPVAAAVPAASSVSDVVLEGPTLEAYKRLCMQNQGVLYEDDTMQIGVKSEYKGHQARIGLFFGNKTSSQLINFKARVVPSLAIKISLGEVSDIFEPRTQMQLFATVECLQVFSEPPALEISFDSDKGSFQKALKMPLALSKFLTPLKMNAKEYMEKWNVMGGEVQGIFKAGKPIEKALVEKVVTGLKFGVLHSDAQSFTTASTSCLSSSGVANAVVLMRVECNMAQQAYRVTVRSEDAAVSPVVKNLIETMLA